MKNNKKKRAGTIPIADKVRFWEEQDRINGVLIPRVIRQGELLAKHIAEHDDLPRLFSSTIEESLARQSSQFKSELSDAKTALNEMFSKTLDEATSEHALEARQELETCLARLDESHKRLCSEQEKRIEATMASLREDWNRSRIRLTVTAVIAVVAAIASFMSMSL